MKGGFSFLVGLLFAPLLVIVVRRYVAWREPIEWENRSRLAIERATKATDLEVSDRGVYPTVTDWRGLVGPGIVVNGRLTGRKRSDFARPDTLVEFAEADPDGSLRTVSGRIVRPDLRAALDYRWRP